MNEIEYTICSIIKEVKEQFYGLPFTIHTTNEIEHTIKDRILGIYPDFNRNIEVCGAKIRIKKSIFNKVCISLIPIFCCIFENVEYELYVCDDLCTVFIGGKNISGYFVGTLKISKILDPVTYGYNIDYYPVQKSDTVEINIIKEEVRYGIEETKSSQGSS